MTDWSKVLIGTSAGFLFGLLAEPIKFWLSNHLKQRYARRLLYSEFARVLVGLDKISSASAPFDKAEMVSQDQENEARESIEAFRHIMTADLFDYYYEKEKPLYYEMPEAGHLRGFCSVIKQTITDLNTENLPLKGQLDSFSHLWAVVTLGYHVNSTMDHKLLNKLVTVRKRSRNVLHDDFSAGSDVMEVVRRYSEACPNSPLEISAIKAWASKNPMHEKSESTP